MDFVLAVTKLQPVPTLRWENTPLSQLGLILVQPSHPICLLAQYASLAAGNFLAGFSNILASLPVGAKVIQDLRKGMRK